MLIISDSGDDEVDESGTEGNFSLYVYKMFFLELVILYNESFVQG